VKHYRCMITCCTAKKEEVLNISQKVHDCVAKSGIKEGLALVYPLHTSSAVYINDSDTALVGDMEKVLAGLVPEGAGYAHDETDCKKNAHGHLRATLAGHHVVMPLTDGELDLGAYQTIYYAEFDGRRDKEVLVKIIGE